jgi:D-ribose pyranose/furanose isomerase RbsD
VAFLLGIPLTIATLTTLIRILSTGGHVIYDTYGVTSGGIGTIKSTPSKRLLDRCAAIAEMLQGVDNNIIITNMGRKLVQTLVDSIAWAHKYDKKSKITKILFSSGHRNKFKECHQSITQDFSDIGHTMSISSRPHNDLLHIQDKETTLIRSSDYLSLEYHH